MENLNTNRLEINSICRLCVKLLGTENVSPIFNNENYKERVTLKERIRYCSSVEVCENDGLPSLICSNCLIKLNESFVFRNQCVLADNTLRRLVKDVNLSLNDIPNLICNIDVRNGIVQHDVMHDVMQTEEENESKNHNIDEFDNSKNGRHKKNIDKTKDESVRKSAVLHDGTSLEIEQHDMEMQYLISSDSESNEEAEVFSLPNNEPENAKKKTKPKFSKKETSKSQVLDLGSEKENGIKIKKSRKQKLKKTNENNNEEIKREIKEEIKEELADNLTVEPDVFSFKEEKRDLDFKHEDEDEEDDLKESQEKESKVSTTEKTVGGKRGRPRKYPVVKKKPSSYTCDYCQKVYPSEGGWRYHIHTMHNENYQPFICDLCGKAFKVKKNLEGHKNSIHYHLKHHLCDLCGRGFASKYALKVHKIWHNDEKNFPCDVCGTKFRTRGKMNTHRTIHGGPKKFMCHVCSRDFRWKKDFEIHMRTHTGEKPFKCSHCGKAFSSLTNMKKHERNHSGKFGNARGIQVFDATAMPAVPDDEMYKTDLPFPFNYSMEDIRNRAVE